MKARAYRRLGIVLASLALVVGLAPWAAGQRATSKARARAGVRPRVAAKPDTGTTKGKDEAESDKVVRSEAEWRKVLSPFQYYVMRQKGTELPFSGKYAVGHFKGTFVCAGCGAELFSAKHKYDSGTGWPSFYQPIRRDVLETEPDYRGTEPRVEVKCARCGSHLGHVFPDGPPPTGQRYCINSVCLKLKPLSAPAAKEKESAKAKSETASEGEPETDTPPAPANAVKPGGAGP
ncbi:MAG: peptide-methionine (R)-S-oxide reductase MsrB [Isosphaeraceae bacterium]|nr:peptide-methionine (R)-S-oxide reductase MsrB [Isosphaeraceae bacterium]